MVADLVERNIAPLDDSTTARDRVAGGGHAECVRVPHALGPAVGVGRAVPLVPRVGTHESECP